MAAYYVYSLSDPRDEVIRYIGVTINPKARLDCHKSSKDGLKEKVRWIADLKSNDMLPIMNIIEVCYSPEEAAERECFYFNIHNNGNLFCENPALRKYTYGIPKKKGKPGVKQSTSFKLSDAAIILLKKLSELEHRNNTNMVEILIREKAKELNITAA